MHRVSLLTYWLCIGAISAITGGMPVAAQSLEFETDAVESSTLDEAILTTRIDEQGFPNNQLELESETNNASNTYELEVVSLLSDKSQSISSITISDNLLNKETRRQGDKETRRQGDKETRRQGDKETFRPTHYSI